MSEALHKRAIELLHEVRGLEKARIYIPDAKPPLDAIEAALSVTRQEAIQEAARAVRSACGACNGTGYAEPPREERRVTRDMAIDAENPEMEGLIYSHADEGTECEYCGRPMSAIRALGAAR